ncbi:AMP-binding protein, partial [Rhodococcus sp. MEB064]|uniref:AMP-binding protein n=1 Tax=Rhodococcus sp. MEB064 TaxID=1587522 RepID=UPI0005AC7101
MGAEARHKVGLLDIAATLPRMTTALPSVLRGLPGFLRKPDDKESIGHIFQRVATKTPDHPFVRFEGDTLTYGQANDLVNRYASVLTDRGVQRGDVVGVLAKNSMRTLLVALATVKLGATAGMLNFNQRGEVLEHSLGILDARVLVVDEDCIEALESLDEALPEKVVLHADELDRLAESASAENPVATTE